jgi:hypothetical protein
MLHWLLKTIGVTDELLVHLDEATLAVQRPWVFWGGLLLLVPVAAFVYRRQLQNLATVPTALRVVLSASRILILAILVTVLAGPYLRLDLKVEKRPIVALVYDRSKSMELPAGPFEAEADAVKAARAAGYAVTEGKVDAEARKALDHIGRDALARAAVTTRKAELLDRLATKHEVRGYAFARDLTKISQTDAQVTTKDGQEVTRLSTHLGDALGGILDEAGGRPIAGIVLFSDGQNTAGVSPAEAARAAAAAGARVFPVVIGVPNRARDVAIVDVFTAGEVSTGDTARIAVTVESQGFDGRPVKVELVEDSVLDSKEIVLHSAEQQVVELSFLANKPGPHYLTVKIDPLPEEPDELRGNNTDMAFVKVSDEKLKVLLVDGLPRWDFRFLKNAMRRDHGLGGKSADEPDLLLEAELRHRAAGTEGTDLPRTVDDLLAYRTVVVGDASPELLDSTFVEALGKAVREKGLGLIVAAGPNHMPHAFDDRFKDLLPVRLSRRGGGLEAPAYRPFRMELSPEGSIHEAMRLYDDPGRSRNVWSQMPVYYWCAAVERAAPGASVLAWNPSVEGRYGKLPLLAHHFAGEGRVLFVATDTTWGWRQNVGDRFFYKFWGQAIRFVARKDEASKGKSTLEVRPVRALAGEPAQVHLQAFGADGAPVLLPQVGVSVLGGDSASRLELMADPAVKGRYTGLFTPPAPGEYRLAYDNVEARLRVLPSNEELRHPQLNLAALKLLADTTGGEVIDLADLGSIPDKLKGEATTSEIHREASVWDNGLTLGLVIVLYSLDVALRRLAGLS